MHQRCVICSIRSWSGAYQISCSRSLCTLSASAPTAHWSARHLLYCSCDLNIWSLYMHLLLLLVMICDQFTEFKVLKLACAFGLVFNASDIPILISPPPPCFFLFFKLYQNLCHHHHNLTSFIKSYHHGGQLLVLYSRHAPSTHPRGNADLSNDRRQLAIFQQHSTISTSAYKTKRGNTPKNLFLLFSLILTKFSRPNSTSTHMYLQIYSNPALPPKLHAMQSKKLHFLFQFLRQYCNVFEAMIVRLRRLARRQWLYRGVCV